MSVFICRGQLLLILRHLPILILRNIVKCTTTHFGFENKISKKKYFLFTNTKSWRFVFFISFYQILRKLYIWDVVKFLVRLLDGQF